jgi:predicted RNA methylase
LTNNFIPEGNRALNACCGIGQLAKYLLNNQFDVTGYDIDRELVEVCSLMYPEAAFFEYDFCQDNQLLARMSNVRRWDLIVSNPPCSKVNMISFINWLSEALSDQGKAIVLMHNDFEYKNYNKHYKACAGRFKILRKEEIQDAGSNPRYAGMRIYLMELSEDYKRERERQEAQNQCIVKEIAETEEINTSKKQIMDRQDMKKIQNVRLDKIVVNPLNPRKKINESDIKENWLRVSGK